MVKTIPVTPDNVHKDVISLITDRNLNRPGVTTDCPRLTCSDARVSGDTKGEARGEGGAN